MNLKALIEKRASLRKELRAYSDKITKEERAMSEDERQEFDELSQKVNDLSETIDRLQAEREISEDDGAEERSTGKQKKETREEIETRERKEFANFIRAGVKGETRADVNLDKGDNGAVIPTSVADKIISAVYDISPVVEKATKYRTTGNIEIPVYSADGSSNDITMAYATEFTDLESKVGEFGSATLSGHLAGALVKMSNSLVNNSDLDLVNFVIERVAYEVARFMEGELLTGTANKIEGLSTLSASQNVDTATASVVAFDDLIDTKNKVKQAHRKNAFWVMNSETLGTLEKMKDGDSRPIFTPDATSDFNGKILGYPVFVSDNMPTIADGATVIAFGDFSGLAYKSTEELEIQVLREKYATQHATGLVAWLEADSKVENNQKLSTLTVTSA